MTRRKALRLTAVLPVLALLAACKKKDGSTTEPTEPPATTGGNPDSGY